MPLPPIQQDQGPFLSFLDYLSQFGEVPRSLLAGKGGAAGRHTADLLAKIPDAVLPGDQIDDFARPEDYTDTSDLLGGMEPGPWRDVVNVIGNTASDPVTYVPGAAAARGVKALGQAAKAGGNQVVRGLNAASGKAKFGDAVKGTLDTARRGLGWYDLTPQQQVLMDQSRASGNMAARTGTKRIEQILAGLNPDEDRAVSDILEDLHFDDAGRASVLSGLDDLSGRADAYFALPRAGIDPQKVRQAAQQLDEFSQLQWDEGVREGVFDRRKGVNHYLARQFGFDDPSATIKRKLETPDQLAKFINELHAEGGGTYERSALKRGMDRAGQQGRLVERAKLGRALSDAPDYSLQSNREQVKLQIEAMKKDPKLADFGHRADAIFNGLGESPPLMKLIEGANRIFKPAAVYGIAIPKVGALVRNQLGGVWQAFSTGAPVGPATRRAWSNLAGAFDDGIEKAFGTRLGSGTELTRDLAMVENAFASAKGDTRQVAAFLEQQGRTDLLAALQNGVLDGFVSSEDILAELARTPFHKKAVDLMSLPSAAFQGLEQRMRLGTFKDLLKRKKTPEQAAQHVADTFLRYDVSSKANKNFRTIVPFGQFMSQTIPQQSKLLIDKPYVATAASSLFGLDDPEAPVYPWLGEQVHIPAGKDERGNAQFISGLGLPLETLGKIPGMSGRDIERNVVASMNPGIKSIIGNITGHDPYFGTPFGSYDKNPITGESSELARQYNMLAGTGLIQPIDTPIKMLGNALDDRKSIGERALQGLTGIRFTSVDQDIAEQQILTQYLDRNPKVGSYRGYFNPDDDGEVDAVLKALRASKKRIAEAKERAEQTAMAD